ncbi:MAG: hypothetical protein H0U35_01030 [Sporichthyaceae bacterium]|nr:hypothetical protein [Sporichthyaceae bacterium]
MGRRALAVVMVVALPLMVIGASPAQAKPFEKGHFEDSFGYNDTFCGLAVHVETTFSGSFVTRTVRDSGGQAFLGHSNVKFTDVITLNDDDPATTEFVVAEGIFAFHEQRATLVGGTVWEFEAIEAGTFTLSDSEGNALIRERGVAKFTIVFDTLGDSMPGGVLISEDVVLHGPHSDAICDVLVAELTPTP